MAPYPIQSRQTIEIHTNNQKFSNIYIFLIRLTRFWLPAARPVLEKRRDPVVGPTLAGRPRPSRNRRSRANGKPNGDWFFRLTTARPGMIAELSRLRASPLARRVIDLERIHALLEQWPQDATAAEPRRREYFQLLTRGLEMARFLAWREGGNR